MKKAITCLLLLLLLSIPIPTLAQGDAPSIQFHLSRDIGYGGLDNKIQGLFSMWVEENDELTRVDFFIDDQLIDSLGEQPFRIQFRTGNFADGEHRLYAIGFFTDGSQVFSNEFVRVFIPTSQVSENVIGLLLPLIAVIAVLAALSAFLPRLLFRDKSHVPGQYGMAGGALCKRCGKAFTRHVWMPNLIAGKLERCPHCGKWQIASRAAPDVLADAVKALNDENEAHVRNFGKESPEERTRRQIDDSRYES